MRDIFHSKLNSAFKDGADIRSLLAEDCVFTVGRPVGKLHGPDAVLAGLYAPLAEALSHLHRRDMIFLGQDNWIGTITRYVGNFTNSLFGITPSHSAAELRAGEFYRLNDQGQIAEARIIFDLPNLISQTGRAPFPVTLGNVQHYPNPATHDGVLPNPEGGKASAAVMMLMLERLIDFDPETMMSPGMIGEDGVWHDDMAWYGPHPIGANYRWDGFVKDHRSPFLNAFPTRLGGGTVCEIGDGNYAALCGEGMPMRHDGDYLGLPATGRDVILPVMDFYRIEDGRLIENWVFLDLVELFHQMGVDVIAGTGWPT